VSKTRQVFTSPMGRIVQGSVSEAQTKDQQGNLRVVKSGPNIGQPAPQFFIALAIPKVDLANPNAWNPEWAPFMGLIYNTARTEWPSLFNDQTPDNNVFGILAKPSVNPLFTFKVKDGDGLDRNGKSNADKPGFPGHWIVSFASSYPPKVVRPLVPNPVNPQDWEAIDPASVKRGYWGRIAGSITGNDSPNTPGLYVNLDMFEFRGIDTEIVGGPDAAGAFGGSASALPAHVQTAIGAPVGFAAAPAPGALPPPGAPGGPGMLPPPAGAPGVPAAVGSPPGAPGGQYTGYMGVPGAAPGAPAAPLGGAPTAAAPSPPGGVPSAPPATISPSRTMTALAGTNTYESFVGAGWTDQQLIEKGYMVVA
jgi:hypothetical protein